MSGIGIRALLNRALQMLLLLVALSFFLFGIMSAMPGDPVDMLITSNPQIRPEDVARLKRLRGLDRPWPVQYMRWVWGYHAPIRPAELTPIGEQMGTDMIEFPVSIPSGAKLRPLFGAELVGNKVRKSFESPGEYAVWLEFTDKAGHQVIQRVDVAIHPGQVERASAPALEEERLSAGSTESMEEIAGEEPVEMRFLEIPTQSVEENGEFEVDIAQFLSVDSEVDWEFSLEQSPGTITGEGVYRHSFAGQGLASVLFCATQGESRVCGAMAVDQAPIPDPENFQRGFLYVLLGDKAALGFSNTYKRPVSELLEGRVKNTLSLMIPAFLLSLLLAIPLGVLSAYRQNSWFDYFTNGLAFIGISLPVFWFGIMALALFAAKLQWFPAGGIQTPGLDGTWFEIAFDRIRHAILPVCVLSVAYTGRWLRYVRASMLEVLPQDYIRTARAKGLPERIVILKHALRNALIPIVTVLALSIPSLFGGAVLTETVFAWPGIGRLQYESVMNNDYYVAIVVFLISAALVMAGNLLADLLYWIVDPRMRKEGRS